MKIKDPLKGLKVQERQQSNTALFQQAPWVPDKQGWICSYVANSTVKRAGTCFLNPHSLSKSVTTKHSHPRSQTQWAWLIFIREMPCCTWEGELWVMMGKADMWQEWPNDKSRPITDQLWSGTTTLSLLTLTSAFAEETLLPIDILGPAKYWIYQLNCRSWALDVTQLEEWLPSMHEALDAIPSTA